MTGAGERLARYRIGQRDFSQLVRANYGGRCCMPGCQVTNQEFLVGSHIARWADEVEARGEFSNGLCLCRMHDRAFELGYFTLDEDYRIVINEAMIESSGASLAKEALLPLEGRRTSLGKTNPSVGSLRALWKRIGLDLQ